MDCLFTASVVWLTLWSGVAQATLPVLPDCQRLEDHVLDQSNPETIFGVTSELGATAAPVKVNRLGSKTPIPTHHFATNMLKALNKKEAMRIFPYEAVLDEMGIVWDAYTMKRWYDPARTDHTEQQSAWQQGKPWVKLSHMGVNLKQMVSAPDGNPYEVFEGESGVRVGFENIQEPEVTDFGELYANFLFSGHGGSMEVPVVRGSILATHIFKDANPVIKPLCLSQLNGQSIHFDCPMERSAGDGGIGYLEGQCREDNTLRIVLHSTKSLANVSAVLWAASLSEHWSTGRAMHTCDTGHCRMLDEGKTVEVTVPLSHGEMSFAVSVAGRYILPWDWVTRPMKANCHIRKRRAVPAVTLTAACHKDRTLQIQLELGTRPPFSLDKVRFAVESQKTWNNSYRPKMHHCDDTKCFRQGSIISINTQAPDNLYKLAVNIIGLTTLPVSCWDTQPFQGTCDGSVAGSATHHTPTGCPSPSGSDFDALDTEGSGPANSPAAGSKENTDALDTGDSGPGNSPAAGSKENTDAGSQMNTEPQHAQNISVSLNANKKFILELNEPGTTLQGQTRKFVLYFSGPVRYRVKAASNEVVFEPLNAGGSYSGLVQLGYLGTGPRGDNVHINYLDNYFGFYSYKPTVSSCVSDSRRKAFLSFEWNAVDEKGYPASRELLMTTLPHHERLLQNTSDGYLSDSLYGFKTYRGNSWSLQYHLHHTPISPDLDSVQELKRIRALKAKMKAAIKNDVENFDLNSMCVHSDIYTVGKSLAMVTRLATISRAFGYSHHTRLEAAIVACLNKWLRIDDSLQDQWKLRYDQVWGGLFRRGTMGDLHSNVDHGFPYYSNHHVLLGYFLYAAAYYAKYNRHWATASKDRLYLLARDVGNPSRLDSHFPVVRHKDFYTGFSWASGVATGQRKTGWPSESINCYHALAALGEALQDPYLRNVGQLHLAMEIASVRQYWQVRTHNRQHFPPMLRENGAASQITEGAWYVYDMGGACDPDRFPMRHGCIVGSMVSPLTAVSRYWVDQEWAGSIRDVCERAINPQLDKDYPRHDRNDRDFRTLGVEWQALCYAAMAPLNSITQTAAANYVENINSSKLTEGSGVASTLLFVLAAT